MTNKVFQASQRCLAAAVTACVFAVPVSAAPTTADAAITLGYDNNQSNAAAASDREDGFVVGVGGSVRQRILLPGRVGLQLVGDLALNGNERFGDLSHIDGGVQASLHFKPVVGFDAPFYSVVARVGTQVYNGSKIRNSLFVEGGANVGMRLMDNAVGRIGYIFDWREAFSSKAFDTKAHRLFANVDYKLTSNWSLYARYDLRMGDTVSTAVPNNAIIAAAKVIEQDDAFGIGSTTSNALVGPGLGPGLIGNAGQRFAYKLQSTSHAGRVGMNYRLSRNMSLDLSARYRKTYGNNDIDYQSLAVDGAFSYRF